MLHYFLISLSGLLIAAYTDLRERMVYNTLTYSLILIGFALKALESLQSNSILPLEQAATAGLVGFMAAYLLWRTGVWAGGDVKLVTALAVLNPVNYAVLAKELSFTGGAFGTLAIPIFPIELIVYSALAVLPLGLLMSFGAVLKHKKAGEKTVRAIRERALSLAAAGIIISGATITMRALGQEIFVVIPVLLITAFLPGRARAIAVAGFGVLGIYFSAKSFALGFLAAGVPLFIIYALWKTYSESKGYAFREEIETKNLEEGMIPDSYIVERNGKALLAEGPSIKRVIKNIMDNRMESVLADFRPRGKVISGPNKAGGLTEEEAEKLREMAQKGLAPQRVFVRKTLAFVPAILVAYIALQLTGDMLWNLVS